jgi:hypothetical protein
VGRLLAHRRGAVASGFKKRKREEASDEELRSFLEAIEKLEALATELGDDETKPAKR